MESEFRDIFLGSLGVVICFGTAGHCLEMTHELHTAACPDTPSSL